MSRHKSQLGGYLNFLENKNVNFKVLELSKRDSLNLMNFVRNRYIDENKEAIEIWFEVFNDLLNKKGYIVVKGDVK